MTMIILPRTCKLLSTGTVGTTDYIERHGSVPGNVSRPSRTDKLPIGDVKDSEPLPVDRRYCVDEYVEARTVNETSNITTIRLFRLGDSSREDEACGTLYSDGPTPVYEKTDDTTRALDTGGRASKFLGDANNAPYYIHAHRSHCRLTD